MMLNKTLDKLNVNSYKIIFLRLRKRHYFNTVEIKSKIRSAKAAPDSNLFNKQLIIYL